MGGWGGAALLDHLILIVGYVSRQAAGQEDPDELEHNKQKYFGEKHFFRERNQLFLNKNNGGGVKVLIFTTQHGCKIATHFLGGERKSESPTDRRLNPEVVRHGFAMCWCRIFSCVCYLGHTCVSVRTYTLPSYSWTVTNSLFGEVNLDFEHLALEHLDSVEI